MKYTPLSTTLTTMADDLHKLAHSIAAESPKLASALICHAARTGLASLAATSLEREVSRHQHALSELHANAEEEAEDAEAAARALVAMEARHGRSRIIADILKPVLDRSPR